MFEPRRRAITPRGTVIRAAWLWLAALLLSFDVAALSPDEIVQFNSKDVRATSIRGLLFKPTGAPPYRSVVIMPGCSGLFVKSGSLRSNYKAWIGRMLDWGYLVLAVDGFTPRGFRTMCAMRKRPLHALDDRPFDAYGAHQWLARQPFARADKIALVGWSNGAMAALSGMRASHASRFGGRSRFTAAAAFYPGCISLKSRTRGRYAPYAPLLVLLGLADDWTLPKPCIELMSTAKKAGRPVEIAAYEGAYHAFDHPNLAVRTRTARNNRWRTKSQRTVTIGSNPAARAAAISRLKSWLKYHLGR